MSFSFDVNVLVAASDVNSELHSKATAFIDSCVNDDRVFYLTWPTLMGYLRIVTRLTILRNPLSPDRALSNIEALVSLPHARVLSEGRDFWPTFRRAGEGLVLRGNLVPDAHVAAILYQHGVKTFYTRDRGFRQFSFLDVRDPFA